MDMTSKKTIILRLLFSPIFVPVLILGVVVRIICPVCEWFFRELFWAISYGLGEHEK
jgi:hypothetical protein